MKNKLTILIFTLFLMLSFGSVKQVLACSPSPYTPPICEMYGKSGAVFIGKIINIKEIKQENVSSNYEITFQVQENFVGVETNSKVTVILSGSTPEFYCFRKGENYLVYASGKDKKFSIDAGTRTRHIKDAGEDLEFIRQLSKQKDGVKISGNVNLIVKSSLEKDNTQPFSGAILIAKKSDDKNLSFQTLTDINGHYEFNDLPAGSYDISPDFNEESKHFKDKYSGSTNGSSATKITNKGCSKQDFTIEPKGKISGKVIDADGNPVKNIKVEIISIFVTDPDYFEGSESADTDSNGEFISYNVPPGLYTISVNYSNPPEDISPFPPTFYPNVKTRQQAQVFEMTLDGKIENLEFRLPAKLNKRIIKGSVFWKDGTPASGVLVYTKERLHDVCCVNNEVITNAKGEFETHGFEGREYRVWAVGENRYSNIKDYGASTPFILDKNALPIRIILDKTESWLNDMDEDNEDSSRN